MLGKVYPKSRPQPTSHYQMKVYREVLEIPLDEVALVKCVQT